MKCRMFGCKYPAKRRFKYCSVCQDRMDAAAQRLKWEMEAEARGEEWNPPSKQDKPPVDAKHSRAERKRALDKRRREELKAEGTCVRCRKAPAADGRVCCADCLKKDSQRRAKKRGARKQRKREYAQAKRRLRARARSGVCVRCPNKAHWGKLRCDACLAAERARKTPA